jgi:putative endonuclease
MTAAPRRVNRGRKARRDGRRAEWLCVLWLMARGYRILGFRMRTPLGEIDILACKRNIVAVVEVKRRSTIETALEAVSFRQRERLLRAAKSIAARRPDLAGSAVRLDLLALAPRRWPRHIRDAWRDS